ncbi:hypothetical protein [Pendulispora albinea]|uniref:Uncharacterized protein n=1 Tax=Pendulispora albinea TaxID=2741071 RepID=A0ABZ2MBF7_9BACT
MKTIDPFVSIKMHGTTPLYKRANLGKVISVLETASLTPTSWSLDERTNIPYDKKEILARKWTPIDSLYLRLRGKKQYEATLDVGDLTPAIEIEFKPTLAAAHVKEVFDLFTEWVKAFQPDLAVTHIGPPFQYPVQTDFDRYAALMHSVGKLASKHFHKAGPGGLAPRTYFGPHYVMQFGKKLLLSTPAASVREEKDGGITIDLVPEPWKVDGEKLIEAWRRAMDHLRPAEILAITSMTPNGMVEYTRAPRCHIGGRIERK